MLPLVPGIWEDPSVRDLLAGGREEGQLIMAAGKVSYHWSPGSGRPLPLAGGRERRGGPSWPRGLALHILSKLTESYTEISQFNCADEGNLTEQ